MQKRAPEKQPNITSIPHSKQRVNKHFHILHITQCLHSEFYVNFRLAFLSNISYNVIRKQEGQDQQKKVRSPRFSKDKAFLKESPKKASFQKEEAKQQFMMRRENRKKKPSQSEEREVKRMLDIKNAQK